MRFLRQESCRGLPCPSPRDLQGIFLTQASNLHLLRWQAESLAVSRWGRSFTFMSINYMAVPGLCCLLFNSFWLHHASCRILVPQTGTEPCRSHESSKSSPLGLQGTAPQPSGPHLTSLLSLEKFPRAHNSSGTIHRAHPSTSGLADVLCK